MIIASLMTMVNDMKRIDISKYRGPSFIQGTRSGWSQKTKKGAIHRQNVRPRSAIAIYSLAHGTHWRKK